MMGVGTFREASASYLLLYSLLLSCSSEKTRFSAGFFTGGGVTASETIYICESRRFTLISLGEMHVRRKRRKFDPHRPGGCTSKAYQMSPMV
jgi:hypothetical protein